MSGSEDEDVVFQGSPLYESIVNTGSLAEELHLEFCSRDGFDQEQTVHQAKDTWAKQPKVVSPAVTVSQRVKQAYLKFLAWLGIAGKQDLIAVKDVEVVTSLFHSSVLDEEDAEFLQSYIEMPKVVEESKHSKTVAFVSFAVVVPLICSYSFYKLQRMEPDWRVTLLSIAVASTSVITLPLLGLVITSLNMCTKYKQRLDAEKGVVRGFIKTGESFVAVLKKCLRLIQETELIARGFTLISQRNPISRLEASGTQMLATRQCPGLRKLVFIVIRDCVHYFREVTKQLIRLAADSENDVTSTYLAFEPIQSYGPCLQLNTSEQDLFNNTDGFSVAALKGIFHLLVLHQSEFIRALTLIYSANFKCPGTDNSQIVELVQTVDEKLQVWTGTVQESYNYHNCSLLSKKPSRKAAQSPSSVDNVYTAVHSLDLHLQSALTRVRAFSVWLEKKSECKEEGLTGFHDDDLVGNIMEPIRSELESCRSCWEEGVNRIEKLLGKQGLAECATDDIGKLSPVCDLEKSQSQAAEIEDYIIEDQVFEAYTDPNEIHEDDSDWGKPLTKEEKEKRKREKKEAMRMLTELKSVISIRAVDWEKRERAVLLRAHPELLLNQETNQNADGESLTTQIADEIFDQDKNKSLYDKEKSSDNEAHLENVCKDTEDGTDKEVDVEDEVENLEEIETERNPLSYVSYQGVRRLRKSNMLDLSDSDSDTGDTLTGYRIVSSQEFDEEEEEDRQKIKAHPALGLPPFSFPKMENQTLDDLSGDTDSDNVKHVDITEDYVEKPTLTLAERLKQFSGANLDMSADIAAQAVAKSRLMGGLTEATFGGEEFGEHSSSEHEDG